MKAKEQAEKYITASGINKSKVLEDIIKDYAKSFTNLLKSRSIKREESAFAVIKELDIKFKSFALKVNAKVSDNFKVESHGFMIILKAAHNPIYRLYMKSLNNY